MTYAVDSAHFVGRASTLGRAPGLWGGEPHGSKKPSAFCRHLLPRQSLGLLAFGQFGPGLWVGKRFSLHTSLSKKPRILRILRRYFLSERKYPKKRSRNRTDSSTRDLKLSLQIPEIGSLIRFPAFWVFWVPRISFADPVETQKNPQKATTFRFRHFVPQPSLRTFSGSFLFQRKEPKERSSSQKT